MSRGESGAATVEHVGVIVLVVAVIAAVVMAATPIGQTVAAKLCQAVGGECGAATDAQPAPDPQPTQACTVSSDDFEAGLGASISVVDLGKGVTVTTEEKSDGTVEVSVSDKGNLGAQLVAGKADAHLQVGGVDAGKVEADANVNAGLKGMLGQKYTFDASQDPAANRAAADEFTEYVGWVKGSKEAGNLVDPSIGAPLSGLVDLVYRSWNDYTPPAPSSTMVEGGVYLGGDASAQGLIGGASASLQGSQVIGSEFSADGSTTVYSKVDLEGDGEVGMILGAEGSAGVQLLTEAKVDKDGNLTSVVLNGTASAEGMTGLVGFISGEAGDFTGASTRGTGKGGNIRAEVPVTDANRGQVIAALGGVGAMTTPVGAMTAPAALTYLASESVARGTVTRQDMDISSQDLLSVGLALKAPAVGGVGVSGEAALKSTQTSDAYYLGDHGWKEWTNCAG